MATEKNNKISDRGCNQSVMFPNQLEHGVESGNKDQATGFKNSDCLNLLRLTYRIKIKDSIHRNTLIFIP